MHTSGRMVFTMTLLAAATPFVLPRVLAPSPAHNVHPAAIDTAHPANMGNTHPADFGNPHPADFGNTHPALTADVHSAFPTERNQFGEDENVMIDPSHLQGNVTFAFPHAAHVTIVLPDGVQFAVNDTRGLERQQLASGNTNGFPGFAPLVPRVLQTNITVNPGAQVITNFRAPNGRIDPPAVAVITNQTENPVNEAAGAQTPSRRNFRQNR
jgi:hypothetical protein